jgi:predicted membrane protein
MIGAQSLTSSVKPIIRPGTSGTTSKFEETTMTRDNKAGSVIPAIIALLIIGGVIVYFVPTILIFNSEDLHSVTVSEDTQESYEYYTESYDTLSILYMQLTTPAGLLIAAIAILLIVFGLFAVMKSRA